MLLCNSLQERCGTLDLGVAKKLLSFLTMSQRTSAAVALGGLAGLAYLSSGSQTFAAAPATANLRHQRTAQTAQAPSSSASTSLPAMIAGGAVLAAAAASGRATRSHGSAPVRKSVTARKALDQSSRYADLSLDEATLIKNGKHVLVAYIMKPKVGNQDFWAGCPYKIPTLPASSKRGLGPVRGYPDLMTYLV